VRVGRLERRGGALEVIEAAEEGEVVPRLLLILRGHEPGDRLNGRFSIREARGKRIHDVH
jgi:hypothetical protein